MKNNIQRIAIWGFSAAFCINSASCAPVPHDKTDALVAHISQQLDDSTFTDAEFEKIKQQLAELRKNQPNNPLVWRDSARAQMKTTGWDHREIYPADTYLIAEQYLKNGLAAEPNSADLYNLLGHLYTHAGLLEKAYDALTKADKIGTRDPWLTINWADYHVNRENFNQISHLLQPLIAQSALSVNQQRMIFHYLHASDNGLNRLAGKNAHPDIKSVAALKSQLAEINQAMQLLIAKYPKSDFLKYNYAQVWVCDKLDGKTPVDFLQKYPFDKNHAEQMQDIAAAGQYAQLIYAFLNYMPEHYSRQAFLDQAAILEKHESEREAMQALCGNTKNTANFLLATADQRLYELQNPQPYEVENTIKDQK